jgi:hypothetical protein
LQLIYFLIPVELEASVQSRQICLKSVIAIRVCRRYVSKARLGCGRASADQQFFYMNGRPVDLPRVGKVLNDLYKSLTSAAIQVPNHTCKMVSEFLEFWYRTCIYLFDLEKVTLTVDVESWTRQQCQI